VKILVTGAAGFIGFHLAEKLISLGHSVVGIDNINDYYDVNLKYARLSHSGIKNDQIEYGKKTKSVSLLNYFFVKLDITDREKLEQWRTLPLRAKSWAGSRKRQLAKG
jgi:UDP-glucuronate 4-epimerase